MKERVGGDANKPLYSILSGIVYITFVVLSDNAKIFCLSVDLADNDAKIRLI